MHLEFGILLKQVNQLERKVKVILEEATKIKEAITTLNENTHGQICGLYSAIHFNANWTGITTFLHRHTNF